MTTVRISVTQLDAGLMGKPHRGRPRPRSVLVDVIDDDALAADHAIAWATARGYHQLVGALGRMFAGEPPQSGFASIINRTHALLVFTSWPWCPRHIIEGEPTTEWPDHQ